jgi:outer membrane cobalamin receptor
LIRRPKHKWMASISQKFKDLRMGFNLINISGLIDSGDIEIDDYAVARIFGTYKFNDMSSIHFRLENALDKEYSYLNGYPAPPRQGYIGMTYDF